MSLTCLSSNASLISFSVESIPKESNTNIHCLRSSMGVLRYISTALSALVLNSSIVTTLTTTNLFRSIPRDSSNPLLTAFSVKIETITIRIRIKEVLNHHREKKVFPVLYSPTYSNFIIRYTRQIYCLI